MNKNKDRNSDIVKQYARGVSGTALAKRYKLSISQTYRIINENRAKQESGQEKCPENPAR
jgi:Mor family transcriptional regulator